MASGILQIYITSARSSRPTHRAVAARRVATTLATRTVSMHVRSCPLLSGQARSPRAFNSGEGFGISAVHNDLALSVRFGREPTLRA